MCITHRHMRQGAGGATASTKFPKFNHNQAEIHLESGNAFVSNGFSLGQGIFWRKTDLLF